MTKHVSQFLAAAAFVALVATHAGAQSITSDNKPRPGSPVRDGVATSPRPIPIPLARAWEPGLPKQV